MPRPNPTIDDGHVPCWHLELHPIAHNHGQFQQGVPVTKCEVVRVLVCCWCGARELQEDVTVPLTHAGASVDTQTTLGEVAPPSPPAR